MNENIKKKKIVIFHTHQTLKNIFLKNNFTENIL
jgi:hypothetical protein